MGLPGVTWVPMVLGILAILLLIAAVICMIIYNDQANGIPGWTWWMFAIGVVVIFICLIWIGIHARNYGLDVAEVKGGRVFRNCQSRAPIGEIDLNSNSDDFGLNAVEETYSTKPTMSNAVPNEKVSQMTSLKKTQVMV